ncbi:MAG: FAD-binding oxidoreductase [Bdellovibrionota bacterium]
MGAFNSLTPDRISRLKSLVGEGKVRSDDTALEQYSHDETENLSFPPEAVVLAESTEDVSKVLKFATQERVPVTPRGAGTGLSGGALPVRGGIVLSLGRMNRILEIDAANLMVRVEAGVVTGELQRQVEEKGLFYPVDPASRDSCQIGGNIAEDSAGPRSCKYGPTRRYVMGLEAVLPSGEVIRTGGKNRKDVTGYNLTQLLVGSEGTLAVVTKATLRLLALPKAVLTVALPFHELSQAARVVSEIFLKGFAPSACEIMEKRALEAVEKIHPVPPQLAGKDALLVVELDGDDPEKLLEEAAGICELAEGMGAGETIVAQQASDQRRVWDVRRKVGEAVKRLSVYKEADTVVPRARLADLVLAAREVTKKHGLDAVCYGHAADGNLHVNILKGFLDDASWMKKRDAAEEELFGRVVEMGGMLSGEHGIGYAQRRLLPVAVDAPTMALMGQIKKTFDPMGILNPGKVFPDA